MRVFVAGATGVLGRPLIRALVARGHEVVGLTRRAERKALVEALGARPAVADALDGPALARAVAEAAPSHVVHLLTALPPEGPLRLSHLRATNILRRQGTANLIAAAIAAGARRLVAESFVGAYGSGDFDRAIGEEMPLPPLPASGGWREAVEAARALEEQVAAAGESGRLEAVTLRFGLLYGPDVPSTTALVRRLAKRQVFLPAGATGVGSFLHGDDGADAILAALECARPDGLYNIVDDEPVAISAYVAAAADAFGTPRPRTAPAWLLRLVAPLPVAAAFSRLPLANAKARRELAWAPRYATVRAGLRQAAAALRR